MKTGYSVADAMTKKPVAVSPNDGLEKISQIMAKEHVSSLPVKTNGNLLGIITEQDIVRNVVAKGIDPYSKKVSDIMAKDLVTIEPNKDIYEALIIMRDKNFRHLPVMDGDKMVGFLTIKDILKIQPQLFELMVEKFEIREADSKPVAEILRRNNEAEVPEDEL